MTKITWKTDQGCPLQSWAFVLAQDTPYCLLLTWRPGRVSLRAFVIPNARNQIDLYRSDEESPRWSQEVFEETGVAYRDDQIEDAQQALVRLLAARLGLKESEVVAARNGRPIKQDGDRITNAQLYQIARIQPQRKR